MKTVLSLYLLFLQERIRVGKELLEAKRIEEENERKRFVFILWSFCHISYLCSNLQLYVRKCSFSLLDSFFNRMKYLFCSHRIVALRKAEKEEEKRAREKIRQKLEEDKVYMFPLTFLIYKLIILYSVFWQGIRYLVIILMYMSKCSSLCIEDFLLKNLTSCNWQVKFLSSLDWLL